MPKAKIDSDGWARSSGCKNCVEVKNATDEKYVLMRDARNPDVVLTVLRDEFRDFVAGVKREEFDGF